MRLILNEKQLLNKSLVDGYIDEKKPSNTVRILIKHYFSIGMNKKQVIDSIDSFLAKNYKGYNSVKWQNSIENMVNKIHRTKDFSLLDISSIEITESELDTIKAISNEKHEKLAFVFLVYAKIYNKINGNEKNWVNAEHKYIFSDAKIAVKVDEQGRIIHKLCELGLLESSLIVDKTNVKVNFVDNNSPVVLVVSDFRNYVYEYLRWRGKKIGSCEQCGLLIIPTGKNQKYCSECWKKIRKEQIRINVKNFREK